MKWKEIQLKQKIKSFQLEDEPELIHVIYVRDNEYIVVHECGYDKQEERVEIHTNESLFKKYSINYF